MRVGIRGVHRRRSNRFLLCDFPDEILLIIFRQLIWINGCYMGYLRFTFPKSKQIFFLLNYLFKQKHMIRFYVNPPLRDILGYRKFHLGKWYQWSISSLVEKAGQNSGLVLKLQKKLAMYPDWQNLIIVCFATKPENWLFVADVSPKSGWRTLVQSLAGGEQSYEGVLSITLFNLF